MVYENRIKKCPFNGEITGVNAKTYTECTKKNCRFQMPDNRCVILENNEILERLEEKVDKIMLQVGAR